MPTVSLKPLHHRNKECLGIYYPQNALLNGAVKKIPAVKWSQTHSCWYIPLSSDAYDNARKALVGKAEMDITMLKQYLEKRKKVVAATTSLASKPVTGTKVIPTPSAWRLSKENLEALEKFVQQLKLKAYSPSTIKTYKNEFIQLLQLLNKKPVDKLTIDELRRYFVYCYEKLKLSENAVHSRINAIKFYFEQVSGREKLFWKIPRSKRPLVLPKLLNETELARLFNALTNKKHKAILFTVYSAGLRVSEIVNLKIADIDPVLDRKSVV